MNDITRIIIGSAEPVPTALADQWQREGAAVRIYRDANRGTWMGVETFDIEYYDSPSCLHHGTSGEHPGAMCLGDAIVFPDGTTWDVEGPSDWPDYDVHCAHCGDLIHIGGADDTAEPSEGTES
jgi:hypothetical protein